MDEFTDRLQAGESPSIAEYCEQYPQLADEIRELFQSLAKLENLQKSSGDTVSEEIAAIESIGEYQILREIGRGGMGVVYEAHHQSLGRRVALKLLPPRLSVDNRSLARFHREARAVAKLHHSNIVPLFEVGNADGRFYFAMQLISGRSLVQAISDASSAAGSSAKTKQLSRWIAKASQTAVSDATKTDQHLHGLSDLANASIASSSSGSNRDQTFRWVARLGLQAAEALDYAHQHVSSTAM